MSTGLYTHTTRSAGTILTADIYNEDHQAHVDGNVPLLTGAYSDDLPTMRTVTDPYPGSVESLATDFAGELARLRFIIQARKSTLNGGAVTYWYSTFTSAANPFAARGARVVRSSNQTITSATSVPNATPIAFDSTRFDTDTFWSGGNPTRLTAPVAGVYLVGANLQWDAVTTGAWVGMFLRDSTGAVLVYHQLTPVGTTLRTFQCSTICKLAAGAYVEVCALQDMTASLDVVALGNVSPEAWITLIGR